MITPMTAVFDLDGTLIDTAPDLLDAINVVLATDGLEAVSRDDLQKLVGHGGRVMIKSAYAQHGRTLDASDIDARIPTFIEAYSKSMPGQSTPYPGVMKLIAAMKADGWQVAICTNKMKQLADRLLASLEIDTVFHAVTGGDSFPFKKPDPRHIEETVNAVAGDPHNAVMFGDSENDIVAAQRADIPVIAVDFGYTPQHVSTFSPTRIISDYRALSLQDVADVIADHRAKAG